MVYGIWYYINCFESSIIFVNPEQWTVSGFCLGFFHRSLTVFARLINDKKIQMMVERRPPRGRLAYLDIPIHSYRYQLFVCKLPHFRELQNVRMFQIFVVE